MTPALLLFFAACSEVIDTGGVLPPADSSSQGADSRGKDSGLLLPSPGEDSQPRESLPDPDTELSGGDSDPPEEPEGGWRSQLYPEDWTPEYSVGDTFLHDFSYAGYHNGEDPLPERGDRLFSVLDYGADPSGESDSHAAIQAAIEAASAEGGVVYLPEGEYRSDERLVVSRSGVTVWGDGPDRTRLFFTRSSGMTDSSQLNFVGSLAEDLELMLVSEGAPRERTIQVEDASELQVGDDVSVGWLISDEFVEEHEMTGTWQEFNGQWRPFFRRSVVAIDTESSPHQVTLDVPLRYPAKLRDSASLRRETGYLSECGVAQLSVSTVAEWSAAWENDRSHAVMLSGVKDCWVQGVESYESPNSSDDRGRHLMSGGVLVLYSKRVSVLDSVMQKPQNRGDGGNGYLFEVSRSSEILFQDLEAREGRHNFIQNWDFGASGIVWLRTRSLDGEAVYSKSWEWLSWLGTSEFHHSLAMANLIDASETNDGWAAVNRNDYSSGAGHAATQSVFWNLSGGGSLESLQFGYGYVIGTQDIDVEITVWDILSSAGTSPEDYTEGLEAGDSLQPESLYEDQLRRRLERGEGLW